jgi:capsular exopolysaccharide synthesis family protein
MSQIHDALNKIKAGQDRPPARAVKPSRAPARKERVPASVLSHMPESALAANAQRISLDTDVMRRNRVMVSSDTPGMNTAYKMLRTRVLHRMRSNHWNRLSISSARPSAGKTLTAINLAISLSFEPNQRVILVDLDLRRPTISQYLGIEREHGLFEYLTSDIPLEKVVVRPNIERLLILPNFVSTEQSSELLSSPRMVDLVNTLTDPTNSTIVIFDLPPLLDADDTLAFSPLFDALLLVVAQSETRRLELEKTFEVLHDIDVLGVVLNKSRGNEDAPGYY